MEILLRLLFGRNIVVVGRLLGFVLGPVVRKVVGPGGPCPHCDFHVDALEPSCGRCGYNPSLARSVMAMPVTSVSSSQPTQASRTGSILPMGQCPNCEEIIQMSSRSCPVCRYTPDPQGSVPA